MGLGERLKRLVAIEGSTKDYLKPIISYSSANIMLGGAGYPLSLYHLQFLTFVEGLGTKTAGTISLISGITDAITDPIMGYITDHTRSRFGRHRRYLLWAILPFIVSYIMKWYSFGISESGNTGNIFAFYLCAGLLYGVAYTMASIPHTAMLPSIAPDYFLRTQYKMVEYIMNSVGQISSFIFTALALSGFNIKVALGALPDPSPSDRPKYLMVGIILSIWFTLPLLYTFFKTSEPSSLGADFTGMTKRNIFADYRSIFKNKAFRQYFIISLFYMISKSLYSLTDQYFIISIANKYKLFNTLNIISGVAEASGSPLNFLLVKHKGKQFCGKLLGPFMVLGLILNIFITPSTPSALATVIILVSSVLYNFGFSGPGFVSVNIQPDVIDVDELITGENREGMVSTFKSFFSKTIASLMSFAVGASLESFGYDTKRKEPQYQTAKSLFGLRLNFIILPAIFALFTVISTYRYKMTKTDHAVIREIIKEKHETGTCTISEEQKQKIEQIAGQKWEDMWIGKEDCHSTANTLT